MTSVHSIDQIISQYGASHDYRLDIQYAMPAFIVFVSRVTQTVPFQSTAFSIELYSRGLLCQSSCQPLSDTLALRTLRGIHQNRTIHSGFNHSVSLVLHRFRLGDRFQSPFSHDHNSTLCKRLAVDHKEYREPSGSTQSTACRH